MPYIQILDNRSGWELYIPAVLGYVVVVAADSLCDRGTGAEPRAAPPHGRVRSPFCCGWVTKVLMRSTAYCCLDSPFFFVANHACMDSKENRALKSSSSSSFFSSQLHLRETKRGGRPAVVGGGSTTAGLRHTQRHGRSQGPATLCQWPGSSPGCCKHW